MIEITAKLIRGPVYFSGEVIECLVTFSNPPNPNHQISQSHRLRIINFVIRLLNSSVHIMNAFSDIFESLAWASAQVHCQCSTNSKIVFSEKLNITARLAAINASKIIKLLKIVTI